MWLSEKIVKDTMDAGVRVFYVSFQATRYWAQEREPGQPLVFSGHYWARGRDEAGPFRSQSGAWRDAWYRVVLGQAPPALSARNTRFDRDRNEPPARKTRGRKS